MPPKRKRDNKSSLDGAGHRPSPHRPDRASLVEPEGAPGTFDNGGVRPSVAAVPNHGQDNGTLNDHTAFTSAPSIPASANLDGSAPAAMSKSLGNTDQEVSGLGPEAVAEVPFCYQYLTDQVLSDWEGSGSAEALVLGQRACLNMDYTSLSVQFQEYLQSVLEGRLRPAQAGSIAWQLLRTNDPPREAPIIESAIQDVFLDSLTIVCETRAITVADRLGDFQAYLDATGIDADVCRQIMDIELLQEVQLVRSTFMRVRTRKTTALLYRQANYNLLREESEGYSKLVTELFSICESLQNQADLAEEAFEKIKGLIGTFDLDVGRALDITLDVFASLLIKFYRFFVKLLRVSSWWPRSNLSGTITSQLSSVPYWALPSSTTSTSARDGDEAALIKLRRFGRDQNFWQRAREVGIDAYFELCDRQLLDQTIKAQYLKPSPDGTLTPEQQWIRDTGTLPPTGNRTAAQLLGFKLRFYTSHARDESDVLPDNLIYLTALLIKIGFISLRDLYSHICPADPDMEVLRAARLAELELEQNAQSGGEANALMRAGALPDDDAPSQPRLREAAESKPDPTLKATSGEKDDKVNDAAPLDQKVRLLKSLLTIGAIPESLYILIQFPWLPELYEEIYELVHRILNHSLQDVYDQCRPSCEPETPNMQKPILDSDQSGMVKGSVRLTHPLTRGQLRWPFPEKFDTNDNKNYRFYWDEWADNVPVCQSIDDVFTLCDTLFNISGVNIGKDPMLLSKLARIGAFSLSKNRSQPNLDRWYELLKRLLVPALSFTKTNAPVISEVYDLLRYYPIASRYGIYAEWFEGQTSRLPVMKQAFDRAKQETLRIMKRISTTNIASMARALAKVAYACPGIVFNIALTQIEAYTNLTEVVVECAKYFTDLGYDVLVWALMSSLGRKDRNRTNAEFALLPSRWLLALSKFSGKIFKRYSIMNPLPVLQYVNYQLQLGVATDLVILQELVQQMGGMVVDIDFTDAQRTALTGGPLLRKQTLIALGDSRFDSVKTAKRLMRALTDTNLAGQILLAIAQHRQAAVYKIHDGEAPIKMLATMIDDTHAILMQYLDLLRQNLDLREFEKSVPSISELLTEFGLEPALAFTIGRDGITHQIIDRLPRNSAHSAKSEAPKKPDVDGDIDMKDRAISASDSVLQDTTNAISTLSSADVDAKPIEIIKELELSSPSTLAFHGVLDPLINAARTTMPPKAWKSISPEFFVTFWTSTIGDISIPKQSYEVEVTRLLKEQEAIMKDRSDLTRSGLEKKDEHRKLVEATRKALVSEFSEQVTQFPLRKARLLRRKVAWFANLQDVKADVLSDGILERCLLPRALFSPSDADFCHRMIRFVHDNNTPHFRTLSLLGRIFRTHRLRTVIFACTVREAQNLGRFLRLILKDLARWHGSKALYEKEALGSKKELFGFALSVDEKGKPKTLLEHDGEKHGFKMILLVWHRALNTALRECLDGSEWMHIRNAITVLQTVVEVFPAVDFMGNGLIKQLETIAQREKDHREDLALTANALLVQMKKRSKAWTIVQAFGHNPATGSPGKRSAQLAKPTLKPTAPEFVPSASSKPLSAREVEDGEVDDSRKASLSQAPAAEPTSAKLKAEQAIENSKQQSAEQSDILLKRDQVKREAAARSALQNTTTTTPVNRPEPQRSLSSQPPLPSRAESLPGRQERNRPPLQDEGREVQQHRQPERDRGRTRDLVEHRSNTEYAKEPARSFDRNNDRPWPNARPGEQRTHDTARPMFDSRYSDNTGRLSREGPPPPNKHGRSSDRNAPAIYENKPPSEADRQLPLGGARAEQVRKEELRSRSPRNSNELPDSRSARTSPRTGRPFEQSREAAESRLVPRSDAGPLTDSPRHASQQAHDTQALSGPRFDDPSHNRDRNVPVRDSRESAAHNGAHYRSNMAFDHARFNGPPMPPQEPNFGRLNAGPSSDSPSGPRDRNAARNNWAEDGPATRRNTRSNEVSRGEPDKGPPTGPSGDRPRRPQQAPPSENMKIRSVAPTESSKTEPSPTVHPTRAKILEAETTSSSRHTAPTPPASKPASQQGAASQPPNDIHPDRLKAWTGQSKFNDHSMPQTQRPMDRGHTGDSRNFSGGPPSTHRDMQSNNMAPSRPLGPAQHQSTMSALPVPTRSMSGSMGTMRDASEATNRRPERPERPERHMNQINNLLKGSMDTSFGQDRGRGRRVAGQASTPHSGPSTPVTGAQYGGKFDTPPFLAERNRNDGPNPSASESARFSGDRIGNGAHTVEGNAAHGRHEGIHGHHGRRSSRSPDRRDSRGTKRPDHADDGAMNRGGDRRFANRDANGGPPPREGGFPRDLPPGPPGPPGRREHGKEREPAGFDGGWPGSADRQTRSREFPRGDGNYQHEGRPPRDEGHGPNGGRKRRSEGDALETRGYDKRPRRM